MVQPLLVFILTHGKCYLGILSIVTQNIDYYKASTKLKKLLLLTVIALIGKWKCILMNMHWDVKHVIKNDGPSSLQRPQKGK